MYLCQQCGKEVHEKFGSGRFCSRSCSNKYVALHQSDEAKSRKVVKMLSAPRIYTGHEMTEDIRKKISESVRKTMSTKEYKEKHPNPMKGKKFSEEVRRKVSEGVKRSHIEGRNPGWMSRNIHSYAENFWKTVLDNNDINYVQEYKVTKKSIGVEGYGCYFLDFLLDGNVDLEIDGKQHADRVEHDKIRDKNLEAAGYKVYRIRFRNPVLSDIVKSDIDKFLEWYNKLRDG